MLVVNTEKTNWEGEESTFLTMVLGNTVLSVLFTLFILTFLYIPN